MLNDLSFLYDFKYGFIVLHFKFLQSFVNVTLSCLAFKSMLNLALMLLNNKVLVKYTRLNINTSNMQFSYN